MDWRREGDYAFAANLDAAGWAWQFLRRCPEYRADHAWFAATWRALEADYGAPPHRDYFRWKQDPRAWRAESEIAGCGTEVCPGENDQVLIECWMGAKWGFRKFPPDPDVDRPEELAWRDRPITMEVLDVIPMDDTPERVALGFDLGLPLEPQIEAARRKLATLRHALNREGRLPPLTPARGAAIWTGWLRLLDGLEAGAAEAELEAALGPIRTADARAMACHGYRRILLMQDYRTY